MSTQSHIFGCAINVRNMDSALVAKLVKRLKEEGLSISHQYQLGHLHKLYVHNFMRVTWYPDYNYIEDKVDSSAMFEWIFKNGGVSWLCV